MLLLCGPGQNRAQQNVPSLSGKGVGAGGSTLTAVARPSWGSWVGKSWSVEEAAGAAATGGGGLRGDCAEWSACACLVPGVLGLATEGVMGELEEDLDV